MNGPMTPARAHFLRASSAQRESAGTTATRSDATAYELMLVQLNEDRQRLSDIQSVERKIEAKRQMLPEYEAWVQGALEGGQGVQDDVLTTVMVWRIDVGDLTGALDIAAYAVEHKLALPDRYKRSLGCVVAEEVADYALRQGDDGVNQEELVCLIRADEITADEDMPDEVRAKLLKAIGYGHDQHGDKQAALECLKQALSKHAKVGVKKDIERIERELKSMKDTGTGASGA